MRRAIIPFAAAIVLLGVSGIFLHWMLFEEAEPGWVVTRAERDAYLGNAARLNAELLLRTEPGTEAGSVRRLVVDQVSPGGPAHIAGVQKGDVVVSVNGQPVDTLGRAVNLASEIRATSSLEVKLDRGGVPVSLRVDFK